MEEEGEWVLVRRATERDLWNPSVGDGGESSKPLKVTFSGPAKHWTDAIPIGNGRLGAMVWGGVASETLQLNEDTLWTGTPGNYTNPKAPEALSEVRKLVDSGKYPEATAAAVKLSDGPSDVYQPLGDIKIEFDNSHLKYAEDTYRRELDLDSATARISYSVGDVEFTREHFASSPDQMIVTKLSGSKPGSLSFTVSLDSKLHHHSQANGKNQILLQGSCPGKRIAPHLTVNDNPKGVQFSAILDVQISDSRGMIQVLDDKKFKVEGCDWVVMLLVAFSSFDGPFTKPSDSKKDPTSDSLRALQSIRKFSYSDLYARHLDDYQNLFHRVSLQLSKSSKSLHGDGSLERKNHALSTFDMHLEGSKIDIASTAERVKSFKTDEDPGLVELLFQYGRYLLISCSRPGTQASNLQGIWSKDIEPAWDCAPHLNINLQMNYWPSLSCNLHECQEPLFDYISSFSVNGSKTAKVNYECSGWVVHQVSDIWAKTSPDRGEAVWALWPMGGAWICTHLWEHYMYTMDKLIPGIEAQPKALSKKFWIWKYQGTSDHQVHEYAYYGLVNTILYLSLNHLGCTHFLLDWLIDGPGGFLETNPSTSPEHMFIAPDGKQASVSYSSTMDMSIIKEVFSAIVYAAEILGKSEDPLIKKVRDAQPRLLPTKIARDGSIMEWALDFEDPEVHHRHVSHLFGLYPGHTITVEKTPDLCKAADFTLFKRGEDGPGWSTTWKIALWARLRNSEHAYHMVKHLFDLVDPEHESAFEGGLYSNLFTAHPPFQIDANFGFSAAVAEMLVQSTVKDLYLLPALPHDKWASGCVKGLKARGGVTVNICWKEGDLQEVGLWSKKQNSLRLHYRGTTVTAKISTGRVYTFNNKLKCVRTYSL
ncbi:hypothetical protein Pint_33715 [Pistacia integerrima]|uniref:Uncharacterized protein n=1 Tax=Pistacia integerrima TaxID=434235 RepID=A0ACC0X7P4_9ROSI|nr:hypothetical protein Pint_33715 [Pistacia integerrima]